ncbi:hypothetical protein HC358_05645 [Wolbachia pipientis]|uniref:Uncharacterized protein n=1 Tax=Wolbachia pipientis TaxID=955 RepID=A0A7G5CB95_WOLPI|nr:hypothetical protein [Wolbachia pipientis]QMV46479.1 hypothetical protein HC358_05645 [Wolbachia pipientis]
MLEMMFLYSIEIGNFERYTVTLDRYVTADFIGFALINGHTNCLFIELLINYHA